MTTLKDKSQSLLSPDSVEQSREGPGLPGRISGSASRVKGTKRKHEAHSYIQQYDAIMQVEKGGKSKKQIAADFSIPPSTLSTWLKKKDDIKAKFLEGQLEPERKRARTAKYPELEKALLTWFQNARAQNATIDGEILKEKARSFASQLGIYSLDFECSNGWLERFKNRHGLVYKKMSGESGAVDTSASAFTGWQSRMQSILKSYREEDIFNADETAIFYRALPDKTMEFKAIPCHGGKVSKERLSVLVCANMSGSEKLPLLVIGKSTKPRCFKNVKVLPTEYRANKKAWMTSGLFTEWVRTLDDKMASRGRKIALIIDNCPAHPDIKRLRATEIIFLPPNTTSITQPMDQGVIKNLKVLYRKQIVTKKLAAIDNKEDLILTVLDGMQMLKKAWGEVTKSTIANCYRHAGFSEEPATSTSDADPDDDIPLAHLIRAMDTTGSLEDFVNFDSNLPSAEPVTDEDIISDLIESRSADSLPTEDNDSEDDDPVPELITSAQALKSCYRVTRYLGQLQKTGAIQMKASDVECFIQQKFLEQVCGKQKNITDFFKPV